MENQKPKQTPSPTPDAQSVNPPTSTLPAAPAVAATTSKPSRFKDECIVLVLSPKGTVHPVVVSKVNPMVRIFDNAEHASVEIFNSKVLQSHPSAILPLKDLF